MYIIIWLWHEICIDQQQLARTQKSYHAIQLHNCNKNEADSTKRYLKKLLSFKEQSEAFEACNTHDILSYRVYQAQTRSVRILAFVWLLPLTTGRLYTFVFYYKT